MSQKQVKGSLAVDKQGRAIAPVVKRYQLGDPQEQIDTLRYWLAQDLSARIEAVEILRRQLHGNPGRLQRVARTIQLAQS